MFMKSVIAISLILTAVLLLPPKVAGAQSLGASYVIQDVMIPKNTALIINQSRKNTSTMGEIVAEQHTMAQTVSLLEKWNREYNDYLKDSLGIAQGVRLGSILYTQGMMLVENLYFLQKAVRNNPQGIAASVPMNNLYMETYAEIVKVYKTLKKIVSKGGPDSMLTGAERMNLLWNLSDELMILNTKIRKTAISIAYNDFLDVWKTATRGMIDHNHAEIANDCFREWQKAYRVSNVFQKD